ncbi:GspH/FimT family pseudopilin [Congregibacter brevis]|uniref:Type II secretion system protein H n=1 Tax=Congregibacter brevis TaxID=3081201 RepID=A0ABZ0IAD1_9GAMM|nr:GspH/FimT family pseudopilin [Congregibacter sp. IMCC45268]
MKKCPYSYALPLAFSGSQLSRAEALARPTFVCAKGQSGFTLIELMMVLVLIAVLLGVGGPSFQSSLQRNRLQSAVNTVATALSFARAEAVIRSQPVSICPTIDTSSCSGSNWETGWLIFVDNNEGGGGAASDGTLNGGEELLRIGEPAPQGVTVRTVNFPSTAAIVFTDSGRVLQNISGTVTVCDERGVNEARALVVEVSGQARRAVDTDGNGVVEDDTVTAVTCP